MKKHYISRGGLKSFMIFGIAFLSIISCRQQKFEDVVTPQDADPIGEVLTADQALDQLYSFIDAMSPATRAEGRFSKAKSIREIKVSGGGLTTRGTICDVPDTLVYVVNFVDDEGFAVLGARRSGEPIYALTESGSFDADKLNAAIAEAQYRMLNGDDAATRSGSVDEPMEEVGLDIIYPLMAEAMIAPTPRITPPKLIKEEYGQWLISSTIGPLVTVKWNQADPYNICIPNGYKTGCVMVAVAQIMSSTRKPILAPGTNGKTYSWNQLLSISNYTNVNKWSPSINYLASTTATQKLYTQYLSDMMLRLGESNCLNAKYNFDGKGSTGALTSSVPPALRSLDATYYANAKCANISTSIPSEFYSCLDNSKPLYVSGGRDGNAAHAWVVDGYMNRKRDIVQYYSNGYMPVYTITRTETRRLLHCNWGYSGNYDGYFAEKIFDMSARISKDAIIDSLTSDAFSDRNYYIDLTVVLS